MKTRYLSFILAALFLFSFHAHPDPLGEKLFGSIVQIKSVIPDDAITAELLGTEREGNGVIIGPDGLILTTGYLIIEAESITITLFDGSTQKASFLAYDHDTGFGLMRASFPKELVPLKLGESSKVKTKDRGLVLAFGGMWNMQGVVILDRRGFAGYWEYLLEEAIFTSPPIQGFAGSALINEDGYLLGIGTLLSRLWIQDHGPVPCNIFIPIDELKPILKDLIKYGYSKKTPKPWLGVFVNEVQGHVIVSGTVTDGPADRAGIKTDDIIISVNNVDVNNLGDFYRKVWALGQAGVEVPLRVLQKGHIREIKIRSVDRNLMLPFLKKMLVLR